MTKFKMLTAAAALTTLVAAPAMAHDAVVYHRNHAYHHYYDPGPIGAAAGIAGAAIGTAGEIATAPFRYSYNDDRYYRGYGYDRYAGPNGYVCQPGTWFRGQDGRRHICR